MKTFVISLIRSIKRRDNIKRQLDNAGIIFEFFDAIDSSTPNFKNSERRSPRKTQLLFGYQLLESELACFSSHFSLWEKCAELNEPILIFEDNCDLTSLAATDLNMLKDLVNKYHFVKLYSMFKKPYSPIEKINTSYEVVYYHERTCGAQGYLITPHAAKQFINNAKQFLEPVDNFMEKPWRHGIATFSFKPDLIKRTKTESTIGTRRKIKKNVRVWHKPAIELFRAYEDIQSRTKSLIVKIKARRSSS